MNSLVMTRSGVKSRPTLSKPCVISCPRSPPSAPKSAGASPAACAPSARGGAARKGGWRSAAGHEKRLRGTRRVRFLRGEGRGVSD